MSYFSFQPVLHDWCNKGRGMCYPVCGTVHIVGRLASTCCQRPAAKRHFSLRVWPQTPPSSLGSLAPLGSPGWYVYAHIFLSPHLPGLLPIVCEGQHRPVRRWPLCDGSKSDATLTDSFALQRARSRGDSCTSPVVVVGRLASTCCQRPAAKRHFSRRVWPQTPHGRWARWLRWARRAGTCMHTCFFFPLICLACFPSSATASTDRCGDGHFSAESDLSQAGGVCCDGSKYLDFKSMRL